MLGYLVTLDDLADPAAVRRDPSRTDISTLREAGRRFWLDLTAVDGEALAVLREDFRFHPLAIEDAETFGQRSKIDEYDDFAFVVAYGVGPAGRPVEVHCFLTPEAIVTVHRDGTDLAAETLMRLRRRTGVQIGPTTVLHAVWDGLADQFYPYLEDLGEQIDTLESIVVSKPDDPRLDEAIRLKKELLTTRRIAAEQRDVLAPVITGTRQALGVSSEEQWYFRDVHDHFVQITHTAEGLRELLSSTLSVQLAATSNRLNDVMKQLTLIATIFLPLTFLTGFFGQNFAWMEDRVGSAWWFWFGGVGLPLAAVVLLVMLFRREGWMSASRRHRRYRRGRISP